ncbi:MAG: hypothetical protein HY608_07255 [Planctomycetes bacterium]|nr:hypothetical protein [Planctomycetota bacterium]
MDRDIARIFKQYVSPDALKALADGRQDTRSLTPSLVEFILVFVRADTPEQVSELMGRIVDVGAEHGALSHDLVSSLVVLAYGTHPTQSKSSSSRTTLVEALQQQFGSDLKIVHGAVNGHYGNIGSSTRMSFSFIIPRFDVALVALGRLGFGQVEEFEP